MKVFGDVETEALNVLLSAIHYDRPEEVDGPRTPRGASHEQRGEAGGAEWM